MKTNKRAYARQDMGLQDTLNAIRSEKSREAIKKYVNEKKANGHELKPLISKLYTIKLIANGLKKPITNTSKEDLVELLSKKQFNTVYHKKIIKEFYRWLKKPELIEWISTTKSVEEKKNARPKITITEEHAASFLAACDNPQDRALFEVWLDNAPKRPKDFENLRVKDVTVNELGVSLKFSSKTEAGNRTIYLQNSRIAFLKFWENHPFKDNPAGPVFYNVNPQHYGWPLKWCGMKGRFKQILKRTKIPENIKRDFTLYTFRRSVATWLLQDPDYTPKEVQVMGGWSSIRMLDIYGKVTDEMVNLKKQVIQAKKDPELLNKLFKLSKNNKAMAKLMVKHGLITEADSKNILGSIICPKCRTENLNNADICSNCWLPLNKKGYDKTIQERERDKNIMGFLLKAFIKLPGIKKQIKEESELKAEFEKLKEYL